MFARLAAGLRACAIASFLPHVALAAAPSLEVARDTTVTTTGLNFATGEYGTSINGQTFQQEALVTFNGWQYAAYWDSSKRPAVARRMLPDGSWEKFVFPDYGPISHTNVHNVITVGVCAEDGTIHLAYDHHTDALHYRRSAAGVATNPAAHTWSAELFGSTTSQLVSGQTIPMMTYPMFFSTPQGKLQFAYRNNISGNGDWLLYEYSSSGWEALGMLFYRGGTYSGKNSRCAYPNPFRYDAAGRLHCTWTWREAGSGLLGNHDLGYAYSDDYGRTWRNNAGTVIAELDGTFDSANAISINSPGLPAYPIAYNWGMMNQVTQYVDSENRPHTIMWRNPDTAASASDDQNNWRYYHYWRDNDGVWHEQLLPFYGRKPQVVFDGDDNMYVIFGQGNDLNYDGNDPGVQLVIASASEASGWTDWTVTPQFPGRTYHGEPLVDVARWRSEGVLSVYFQERPGTAGQPSALRVTDFTGGEPLPVLPSKVQLRGNNILIQPGDATPRLSDHTDFRLANPAGGSVTREFTIQNSGEGTLSVGLPSISGPNSADFAIVTNPAPFVAPGASTTFRVKFDPSADGLRTATILFATNDPDIPVYAFAVQGTGGGSSRAPLEDSFVRDGMYANMKFGTNVLLEVKLDVADLARESYLKFDVSGLAEEGEIKLILVPVSMGAVGSTAILSFEVASSDGWTETGITWSNKPSSTTELGTATGLAVGQPVIVDVTEQAQTDAAGDGVLSVRIRSLTSNGGAGISFASRENTNESIRPALVWGEPEEPHVPEAPASLEAMGGSEQVQLTWVPVEAADGYHVLRSANAGGPYATVAHGVEDTTYIDTDVTEGESYYYVVHALNDIGESAASPEAMGTVLSPLQSWRLAYFGTHQPAGEAADGSDPDGDGMTNIQEFFAGTNPMDASSLLRIHHVSADGTDMVISFPTVAGKAYECRYSGTLASDSWEPFATGIEGTGEMVEVRDMEGALNGLRFYKVAVLED